MKYLFGSSVCATIGFSLATTFACSNNPLDKSNSTTRKPNILFIAVDDLRPELGCYGNKIIFSPNIKKLARDGVVFTRAYCNVSVSGASRASLLTGTRPTDYRFLNANTRADIDNKDAVTLPEYFRINGYYTVSLSKVFHHYKDDSKEAWDEIWGPSGGWYLLKESSQLLSEENRGFCPTKWLKYRIPHTQMERLP